MPAFLVRLNVWIYRLLRGGPLTRRMLLLTTRGRKSGQQCTVPLGYIRDGDALLVIASNAGSSRMPGWYFNLRDDPNVEVELGSQHMRARAEDVPEHDRQRLWDAVVAAMPNYAGYAKKASRVIPLARLHLS
jgi:F420H(2)-dependent quinone reductase